MPGEFAYDPPMVVAAKNECSICFCTVHPKRLADHEKWHHAMSNQPPKYVMPPVYGEATKSQT